MIYQNTVKFKASLKEHRNIQDIYHKVKESNDVDLVTLKLTKQ